MPRHFPIVAILAQALVVLAGCNSSSTSVTNPSPAQRCAVTISGPTTVGAAGGSGSLTVSTDRDCQWTAQAEAQWLSLSPTSGQGAGAVGFAVSPNQSTAARSTQIVVNGQPMEITQAAGSCEAAVSPTAFGLPAQGGEVKASLSIANFCGWTVVSRAEWIAVSAGNGTGPAEVSLMIAPNAGPPRSGSVDIAGTEVNVSQASQAAGCSLSVDPTTITVGAQSTQAAVTVTADTGCAWSASSTVPWIGISSGGSGSGSGRVVVDIAANQGGARTGQLLIGGQLVRIDQSGPGTTPCSYSITPTSATIGAAGGQLSTQVTTNVGCAWTATSQASWLRITSGSLGNGPATVSMSADANGGEARSGTVNVAGESFTVTQAASQSACSYNIDPTSYNTSATGGQVTVAVSTAAGCAWSTTDLPEWITVTDGSGSGSGAVTVVVGTNAGPSRNATIQIAGRPFTVTQEAAACSYTVTPTTIDADGSAQTKTVTVATGVHCSWTATVTTSEDWLRIKSGSSGTGAGTVTIEIDAKPNQGNKLRTATLLVAGQTVTVSQQ
jgi:hypothetical protein